MSSFRLDMMCMTIEAKQKQNIQQYLNRYIHSRQVDSITCTHAASDFYLVPFFFLFCFRNAIEGIYIYTVLT